MTFQQMLDYETKQFMWNSQKANPNSDIEQLIESNKSQIFKRTLIHFCSQEGIQKALDQTPILFRLGKKYGVNRFGIEHMLYHQLGNHTKQRISKITWVDFVYCLCLLFAALVFFGLGYYFGSTYG